MAVQLGSGLSAMRVMPTNSSAHCEATSFEAQSSPQWSARLNVGHLVGFVGRPEPIEPRSRALVRGRARR